ncbi:hypothetical protein ATY81_27400 [Rhizobium sp. R72]|nr:hypothetical protein ATY81_27400 [Rhizobium sp. R72]OWV98148.1 hypothetical protein ATY80_27400 [Rhizobium sp. R711]
MFGGIQVIPLPDGEQLHPPLRAGSGTGLMMASNCFSLFRSRDSAVRDADHVGDLLDACARTVSDGSLAAD